MSTKTTSLENDLQNSLTNLPETVIKANSHAANTPEYSESELSEAKQLLKKLLAEFPEQYLAIFVTSKIKAIMPKVPFATPQQQDYQDFIDTLDAKQLMDLRKDILSGLLTNDGKLTSQAQSSVVLAAAVNAIVLGKPEKKQEFKVDQAFDIINSIMEDGMRAEAQRQEDEAAEKDPEHKLEENELKVCGHPYKKLFEDTLPSLAELDLKGYGNFNRVIRKQIRQYKRQEITLDVFVQRLRYSASMLAIALEQRGYITESMQIRTTLNNQKYIGDGKLVGAFVNKNKKNPNKKRELVSEQTKQQAAGFLSKLKQQAKDLPSLLGLKNSSLPKGITLDAEVQKLPNQVSNLINVLETTGDPEAIRRLENRIIKLRAALNAIELAEDAGQNIDEDDPIREELPYNNPQLLRAFMQHLEKLKARILPDAEKTYFPTPSK